MAAYLAFIAVLLIASDLAVGLVYDGVAPATGKRNIEILLGQRDVSMAANERPHPYLLWENTPEYVSPAGVKQTNNLGYRNRQDTELETEQGTLRILALGGSTTWGYYLDDPDDAWPSQMSALLEGRLGPASAYEHIEVINGGLNFGMSAELLLHYLFRDRYLHPDVVVVHTGGNDTAPLLFHDYQPDYADFRPGWTADIHRLRAGERSLIERSHLVRLFYSVWLNDSPALPHITKEAKSFELSADYYVKSATANEPVGFRRNLDLLLRNIVSDGSVALLFPFVSISEEQVPDMTVEATARVGKAPYRRGFLIALAKNQRAMEDLSRRHRVPLVRLDAKEIPAAYFMDHVHLSRDGEAIKARRVADYICRLVPGLDCDATD